MRFACSSCIAFSAGLLLQACGGGPVIEPGLDWNGVPLHIAARVETPPVEVLHDAGFASLAMSPTSMGAPPRQLLRIMPGEWGDSLKLLEFDDEKAAYVAFQDLASRSEDVTAGTTVCGTRVCFRRGRWIGMVDAWEWKGEGWLESGLSLPGNPLGGGAPSAFESLLQQGRLSGSERILTGDFLGMKTRRLVFSVQVDCYGDTAWLYAAPELSRQFGDSLARLPGWQVDSTERDLQIRLESGENPTAVLRFRGSGMVGVEGCFDYELTESWLKKQGRALKAIE